MTTCVAARHWERQAMDLCQYPIPAPPGAVELACLAPGASRMVALTHAGCAAPSFPVAPAPHEMLVPRLPAPAFPVGHRSPGSPDRLSQQVALERPVPVYAST